MATPVIEDHRIAKSRDPWFNTSWGEPAPFDLEGAIARYVASLPRFAQPRRHGWREQEWSRGWLFVEGALSREEAAFWFHAATEPARLGESAKQHVSELALADWTYRRMDWRLCQARLQRWLEAFVDHYGSHYGFYTQRYLVRCMRELIPPHEVLQIILDVVPEAHHASFFELLGPPPQDPEEAEAVRQLGASRYATADFHQPESKKAAVALIPWARLESTARRYLEVCKADYSMRKRGFMDWHVLDVLSDDDEVMQYVLMLCGCVTVPLVHMLYGRMGDECAPFLAGKVRDIQDPEVQRAVMQELTLLDTPLLAPSMAQLAADSPVSRSAMEWLCAHPEEGARALVDQASLARGDARERALAGIRKMVTAGHGAVLESVLEDAPEGVQLAARHEIVVHQAEDLEVASEDVLPGRLSAVSHSGRIPGWPRFASLTKLPQLQLFEAQLALPEEQVRGLLSMALQAGPRDYDDTLPWAAAYFDERSAGRFAWHLLEAWQQAGCPDRHQWVVMLVGFWGAEVELRKLAALIDAWSVEGARARAMVGVSALAASTSTGALLYLHDLAQRTKFRSVREAAKRAMKAQSDRFGVTTEVLEDMSVPDCGLDERGKRVFDYGARQFTLHFDEAYAVRVCEVETGKVHRSLPRARKSDDERAVGRAKAEFSQLKRDVTAAVRVQRARLDRSLVHGRRWRREHWETYVMRHPLVRHLTCGVIWGVFDRDGVRQATFRVSTELELFGMDDEPMLLPHGAIIGAVHPLHFTDAERAGWGEQLAAYEVAQPIEQLERGVHRVDEKQASRRAFEYFTTGDPNPLLDSGALRGMMKRREWTKGFAQWWDGERTEGRVMYAYRQFPKQGWTAFVELSPGLDAVDYKQDEPQRIERVTFVSGIYKDHRSTPAMMMEVDSVVFSEVMRDVQDMRTLEVTEGE